MKKIRGSLLLMCIHISGTAYSHGLKHASGNFVVIMDADLSHHVSRSVGYVDNNLEQC